MKKNARPSVSGTAILMPVLLAALTLLPLGVLWALYGQRLMELIRAAVKLAVLP